MIVEAKIVIYGVAKHQAWTERFDYPRLDLKVPDDVEVARNSVRMALKRHNKRAPDNDLRRLLSTKVLGPSKEHCWEKSNLVTISKGGRMYDTARCTLCGATAKRFGIGGGYTLDAKQPKICPKGK